MQDYRFPEYLTFKNMRGRCEKFEFEKMTIKFQFFWYLNFTRNFKRNWPFFCSIVLFTTSHLLNIMEGLRQRSPPQFSRNILGWWRRRRGSIYPTWAVCQNIIFLSRFEVFYNWAIALPNYLYILLGNKNTLPNTAFRNSKIFGFFFFTLQVISSSSPQILPYSPFTSFLFFPPARELGIITISTTLRLCQ